MARLPNELIDQIRNSVDIVDVISQDVQLRKQGKNLMGHCPFHRDDTPSFSVNEEKQFFYCFSCHRSGNVFGFLQQLHDMSFPEAVKKVAEIGNVQIPTQFQNNNPQHGNQNTSVPSQLLKIHEEATKLFHHILLNTEAGRPALHYLEHRGTGRDLIKQFDLGFAPNNSDEDVLLDYFTGQKVDYQLLRKTGLFVEDQNGNLHDRFKGRVMYPIKDDYGRVIAFSGRILDKKASGNSPKYLNSPETPLFNKRQVLFNIDEARKVARKEGYLTLFEGFMDIISAFGAGVQSGIASMGTSLTEDQVHHIQRISKEVHICYDGDEPGQNAINRAVQIFQQNAPNEQLKIVQLPAGIDPDEYVQKYGGIRFSQYMSNSTETVTEFKLRYLQRGLNLSNHDELMGYINAALRVVAQVNEPVARELYLKRLAERFSLDTNVLKGQLQEVIPQVKVAPVRRQVQYQNNKRQNNVPQNNSHEMVLSRTESAQRRLLKYFFADEAIRQRLHGIDGFKFIDDTYNQIYDAGNKYFVDHDEYTPAAMMDYLSDQHLQSILSQIDQININVDQADEVVNDCINVILQEAPLKQQILAKRAELNNAVAMNNQESTTRLAEELIQLYQREQEMKTEETN